MNQRPRLMSLILLGSLLCSAPSLSCDLCAVYRSMAATGSQPGLNLGLFQQFTHFGTLQQDGREVDNPTGQRLDSSITQFNLGYQLNERAGLQLSIPYIHRTYRRPTAEGLERGRESGLGDMSLLGHLRVYQYLSESVTVACDLLGGIKFPTGSGDRISEELAEEEGGEESGIHGHDLALGSGSWDGIVGSALFVSWGKLFVSIGLQYTIRSRGDFDYRYANDLHWSVKPGGYLWLSQRGTLGLQLALTGEEKGRDDLNGVTAQDTGISTVALGPELNFTWKEKLHAQAGVELPLVNGNTALQMVPDYRIKAALTWRF